MYISIEDFLRKIPGGVQVNGNETAVPVHMVSQILDIVSKNQWIILGGDVLTAQGEYALANWYYEPNAECPLKDREPSPVLTLVPPVSGDKGVI